MPAIRDLPDPPGPDRPSTLETDTLAFLVALKDALVPDINALAAYLAAAATPATSIAYVLDTSSVADSDPGAGYIKLNNATQASATVAYADLLDRFGATVTAILEGMDDSTSATKGWLRLQTEGDATRWVLFRVTGAVVTATGYRKLPLAFVAASVNPLADEADIRAIFTPNGDKGDTGPQATVGPQVIFYEQGAPASPSAGNFVKHNLNTAGRNTGLPAGVTVGLSGGQITIVTLSAVTFTAKGFAQAHNAGGHTLRLRNITDSTDAVQGMDAFAEDFGSAIGVSNMAVLLGSFTVNGTKVFEFQHYASAGGDFGSAAGVGWSAILAMLTLEVFQ